MDKWNNNRKTFIDTGQIHIFGSDFINPFELRLCASNSNLIRNGLNRCDLKSLQEAAPLTTHGPGPAFL